MTWLNLMIEQRRAIDQHDAEMLLWTSLAKSDFAQTCELAQMMQDAEVKERS